MRYHLLHIAAVWLIVFTAIPAFAQWNPDGVQLFNRPSFAGQSIPDGEGGFWSACNWDVAQWERRVALQHVDSDGNRTWPVDDPFLAIDDGHRFWLVGITTGPNGDCIVIGSKEFYNGGASRIYAQRVTQQGERVWGEGGIRASTLGTNLQIPLTFDGGHCAVSDDAGGAWFFWTDWEQHYVGGINADGTRKTEEHWDIPVPYITWPHGWCKDGQGGVITMHKDDNNAREISLVHILPTGETVHDEPQVILSRDDSNWYGGQHFLIPDREGGYYFTSNSYWQRVSADLQPLWDVEGVRVWDWEPTVGFRQEYSNPVVMADNSIVSERVHVRIGSPWVSRIERLLDDGTRYWGPGWGPTAGDTTVSTYTVFGYPLNYTPDAGNTYISVVRAIPDQQTFAYPAVRRLTADGQDVWTHGNTWPDTTREYNSAVRLQVDSSSMVLLDHQADNQFLFAYKINLAGGCVVGDPNKVDEDTEHNSALPVSASISRIYPNPANSTATVDIQITIPGDYVLNVFNVKGRLVHTQHFKARTSDMQLQLALEKSLSSGLYLVQLAQNSVVSDTQKLVWLK